MKWYKLLILSLISGLLLSFSWYPHGLPFLIFFALIPLFFLSDDLLKRERGGGFGKGFLFAYPGFLVWNAITTYWICYCTVPGGLAAVILNAMLQALVFAAWHACRKHISTEWHPILLASFWMAFEYLHLNWDLTWPWLNLGNVFAVCPQFVQWYSVTGAFGGTLWILLCNYLFYNLIRSLSTDKHHAKALGIAVATLIVVPIVISCIQYAHYNHKIDKSTPINVAVVQPNTDVWEEEFRMSNTEHAIRMLQTAQPYLNDSTHLVLCPETCMPHTVSMEMLINGTYPSHIPTYGFLPLIDNAIVAHPNLNFIIGISAMTLYDHKASITAMKVGQNQYIDMHNSAICYGPHRYNGHHHKMRLVPGVESLPFPKIFGFLGDIMINLGGTHSSLAKDTCFRIFPITAGEQTVKVSTAICYESIYGELCSRFVRNGAELLTVITNDSWWNDSPGHTQHFEMSRLRAVENRRYVVRSANGGTSGVIDPLGNVLQRTQYEERTAFDTTVYAQQHKTFYSKYGDLLAKIAVGLSFVGLLLVIINRIIKAIQHRRNRS
ncbi:MAG: apolipoprotein N-acyltransferase [Bacteroidales bacterium]|nr:apolipoprotein N-acyltransferase [Bacteroidales bacterium]